MDKKELFKNIVKFAGNPTVCGVFGHKKIYLEAMAEGEIDGWCCERCNYVHIDKQH